MKTGQQTKRQAQATEGTRYLVKPYGRAFALYDSGEVLIAVFSYLKGAAEVVRRLQSAANPQKEERT